MLHWSLWLTHLNLGPIRLSAFYCYLPYQPASVYRVLRSHCSTLYKLGPEPSYSAFVTQIIWIKVPLGVKRFPMFKPHSGARNIWRPWIRTWNSEGNEKKNYFFWWKRHYEIRLVREQLRPSKTHALQKKLNNWCPLMLLLWTASEIWPARWLVNQEELLHPKLSLCTLQIFSEGPKLAY